MTVHNTKGIVVKPTVHNPPNTLKPQCELHPPLWGRYVYASAPKPVRTTRPAYRNKIAKPRGGHDFYNMMWDPHVYRGDTSRGFKQAEKDRCDALQQGKDRERKKNSRIKKLVVTMGGITRPITPVNANDKNKDIQSQTDKFLEEVSQNPVAYNASTQTEAEPNLQINPVFINVKLGYDAETQLDASELFNFDVEVKPLVEAVVMKVLEQSLLETMEEQELSSLLQQQNRFGDRQMMQQVRYRRLHEREQHVRAANELRAKEAVKAAREEIEVECSIGASKFATSFLHSLKSGSMAALRRDKYIADLTEVGITDYLVPWINKHVIHRVKDNILARDLLSDIVQTGVVDHREAIVDNMFNGPLQDRFAAALAQPVQVR